MTSKRRSYRGSASSDPDKAAARRRAKKEAKKRGALPTTKKQSRISKSQGSHATNPRARRKARDGKKKT